MALPNEVNWNDVPDVGGIPYWKMSELKVNDSITGLFLEIIEGVGQFNSTVASIERDSGEHQGEKWYIPLNSVLMTKLGQIKAGGENLIRVEYLGKVKGEKGGREYNNFRVQAFKVNNLEFEDGGKVTASQEPASDVDLDNIEF